MKNHFTPRSRIPMAIEMRLVGMLLPLFCHTHPSIGIHAQTISSAPIFGREDTNTGFVIKLLLSWRVKRLRLKAEMHPALKYIYHLTHPPG